MCYAKQPSVSKQPVGSIVGAGAFIPRDLISKFHNNTRKHLEFLLQNTELPFAFANEKLNDLY